MSRTKKSRRPEPKFVAGEWVEVLTSAYAGCVPPADTIGETFRVLRVFWCELDGCEPGWVAHLDAVREGRVLKIFEWHLEATDGRVPAPAPVAEKPRGFLPGFAPAAQGLLFAS